MNASFPHHSHPPVIGMIGGSGKMGRMFRRLFEADGYQVLVAGRSTELSYEELAHRADVVIITVPVRETPAMIRRIAPAMRPEQLLSDFTSVKGAPVEAMLDSSASVIGCHPVFGPMSDPAGQNVVLCPARPGPFWDWYQGFFLRHGMKVFSMTPPEHDEAMAFIQGLTHFINIVFARTLQTRSGELERLLQVCSPVYRLLFATLGRILSGEAELYTQIQLSNPDNTAITAEFLKNGTELLNLIKKGDEQAIEALFNQAADYLGDFKAEARRESDFLIQQLIKYLETLKGDNGGK